MTDITISEFADALRREVKAEMRVHQTEADTALRDIREDLAELRDGTDRIEQAVGQLTATVEPLIAGRARRARIVRRVVAAVNTAPGTIASLTALAGMVAGAIALL